MGTVSVTETEQERAIESKEEFRARVRSWLEANVERRNDDDSPVDGNDGETVEALERTRRFQAKLFDAGLAGLSWPPEYGGQGLTMDHQLVFNDETEGYDIPVGQLVIGLGMCAPTILEHGTEEHRKRHIAKMLRADEIWCQLFSEPGAGSDVASLQTRAVRDGDEWVINGQKVWTSGAHFCDYGLLIARTDPEVPKHRGISMFIVDMKTPGVTIRPLRQMTGGGGFNEVFFDDVRIPVSSLVGEVDRGWQAAMSTLMNERVSIGAGGGGLGLRIGGGEFSDLQELAEAVGAIDDPVVRQKLAEIWIDEHLLDWMSAQIRADVKSGRAPGPEGSIAKLVGTELARDSSDFATELLGEAGVTWDENDSMVMQWVNRLLSAPGKSVAGGTPEIMRNILGERVLGLPKEPQVDRDIPFRELRAG